MEPKGCRTDILTQSLAFTLEAEFGVSQDEMDAGYMVTGLSGGEFVDVLEGAGDGCLSYREVIAKAAEVATHEAFSICGEENRIAAILAEDFGIKLPWLFYDESNPSKIDNTKISNAVLEVDGIKSRVQNTSSSDCNRLPPKKLLAKTIFEEITPFHMFRSGDKDPLFGVWRLHSAMLAAGLESSFVLIQDDPLGEHFHKHVALSVKVDDGRSVIIDPAYETFDLQGMNPAPLDTTQALSYLYYHQAISSKEPLELIRMARSLDKSNLGFMFTESKAASTAPNPLAMEQSFYWNSFERAREIVRGEAEMPQSESGASLDLVMRTFR